VDKYIPSIAPNNILSGNEEFSLVLNLPTIIENLFINRKYLYTHQQFHFYANYVVKESLSRWAIRDWSDSSYSSSMMIMLEWTGI
jgi:hypothetical protein